MKITCVTVKDFKRIREIKITPDADRAVIFLGGKNAQGKSSLMDALSVALGGKRMQPSDPVRHGADEASIFMQLDNGLTVRRVIAPDGESHLEVRDELGAVKAPQSVLDKLVSGRFLDPLSFLALPAKEQRAQLMNLIEGADRIAGLNEKKERVFTKRTEIGRDLAKAEGELARLPVVAVADPIDVAELTAEAKRLAEMQRAGDGIGRVVAERKREVDDVTARLVATNEEMDKLEARLAELKQRGIDLASEIGTKEAEASAAQRRLDEATAKWAELQPRRETVDADLARADKHNQDVYAKRAHMERRSEAASSVEQLGKERDDLTKLITTIDERKAEILGAAKLPVEGLSIDDEGITLNGVPFAQASRAEQVRVALALAIAASPQLGDVWIRDGAVLDEESLEAIAKHAGAADKRVWIERVGTSDPGVIVIQDGRVAS